MVKVYAYGDKNCATFEPFLKDLIVWCEIFDYDYNKTYIDDDFEATIDLIRDCKELGFDINEIPYTVIKDHDGNILTAHGGALDNETIKDIFRKYE